MSFEKEKRILRLQNKIRQAIKDHTTALTNNDYGQVSKMEKKIFDAQYKLMQIKNNHSTNKETKEKGQAWKSN